MFALRAVAGAAAAVVALMLSISAASACWSGCGYQTYVPPPMVYAPPSCGCGSCGCGYQGSFGMPWRFGVGPAYQVDQGPVYNVPPPTEPEPVPDEYGPPRHWGGWYHRPHRFYGHTGFYGRPGFYGHSRFYGNTGFYGHRGYGRPWMHRRYMHVEG